MKTVRFVISVVLVFLVLSLCFSAASNSTTRTTVRAAPSTVIHWYNITASAMESYQAENMSYEDARSREIADFGNPDDFRAGQVNSTSYQIWRSSVLFNVSSLAGVNWTALQYALVQLHPGSMDYYPYNLFNLTLQHSSTAGIPKCNQTWPFSPEDYNMSWYGGDDGSVNASTLTINAWNSFNLTSNGVTYVQNVLSSDSIARWILRIGDDINDVAPVGTEYSVTFNAEPYQPILCIGIEEAPQVPEFPSILAPTLLVAGTIIALAFGKKKVRVAGKTSLNYRSSARTTTTAQYFAEQRRTGIKLKLFKRALAGEWLPMR